MRTNSITRKFGKLLRIDVSFDQKIREIKITGDFFMHPEDTLEKIVSEITGSPVPIQQAEMTEILNTIVKQHEAELIGITTEDIVSTLDEATQ